MIGFIPERFEQMLIERVEEARQMKTQQPSVHRPPSVKIYRPTTTIMKLSGIACGLAALPPPAGGAGAARIGRGQIELVRFLIGADGARAVLRWDGFDRLELARGCFRHHGDVAVPAVGAEGVAVIECDTVRTLPDGGSRNHLARGRIADDHHLVSADGIEITVLRVDGEPARTLARRNGIMLRQRGGFGVDFSDLAFYLRCLK